MIFPAGDQRAAFIGYTGSGKTKLARVCLRRAHLEGTQILVLDPKHEFEPFTDSYVATNSSELKKRLNASTRRYDHGENIPVIYRPNVSKGPEELDIIFKYALDRQQTLVYIDELVFVASGSNFQERAPWYYYAVTTGRSKGVGIWASVQRPAWVPLISLTETEVRTTFYLRKKSDRITMEDVIDENIPWHLLRKVKHSFVQATDEETVGPFILPHRQAQAA